MRMHILLAVDAALLAAILLVSGLLLYRSYNRETEQHLSQIQAPDWYTQDFLTVNPYSRPGTKREHVRDIVIHYVANPGTSAKQNRNYFEGLKDQSGSKTVSASSHYIIGSDGTILQCIPLDEVAYGNYPRNDDTAKDLAPSAFFGHVKCCHPDSDGRFTDATIKSLIRLTGWLCRELSLNEKHIIRHYDVSGKNCPKYYVEHQDAWRTLKKKLAAGIQQ